MAYTRTWNNATPAGTRAAKEIDSAIQEAKVDVYDRLLSLLDPTTDIDDDPLVLKAEITGNVTDRQLLIGPHILNSRNDEDDVKHEVAYFETDDAGEWALGTIVIPVGYVIKLFECFADKNTATNVIANLYTVNVTTGALTDLTGDLTRNTAGIGVITSAALNYTVLNTDVIAARFRAAALGNGRCYGFRITYDRSGSNLSY